VFARFVVKIGACLDVFKPVLTVEIDGFAVRFAYLEPYLLGLTITTTFQKCIQQTLPQSAPLFVRGDSDIIDLSVLSYLDRAARDKSAHDETCNRVVLVSESQHNGIGVFHLIEITLRRPVAKPVFLSETHDLSYVSGF
jgi:hypothetical protein